MIIVDTNILVYLWLPSNRLADVLSLAELDPVWTAPILWRSEFRNVATGFLRSGKLTSAEAVYATDRAANCLLGGEHLVDDAEVFKLVSQSKCTSYDCEFVALSQKLGAKLITEDKELLRSFPLYCVSLSTAVGNAQP